MARKPNNTDASLTVEVKVEEVTAAEDTPVLSERTRAEMDAGREALAAHVASLSTE